MNQFTKRLKELREERKLSQNDLARELKISAACISRWEKGLRVPNIESIMLLCKYFDCSADYLIGIADL
ncbi:MAG: helix-turn-helix domain-containing protein [Clostridiales bacterium]|nr:helix-turn-helix domain-containing protein [Clostridiales bacterium]